MKNKAFTLVEFFVLIAIVSIFMAIILPVILNKKPNNTPNLKIQLEDASDFKVTPGFSLVETGTTDGLQWWVLKDNQNGTRILVTTKPAIQIH